MLEQNGVRLAAISYDSQDTLQAFAQTYHIEFPLLSDRASAVIRSFGIFNANIAPGLRAHGVPHPVEYLVSPDGVVVRKYFVANYQHRVTASAVALHEFGLAGEAARAVTLQSGALTATIGLSSVSAFAGQEVGFVAAFTLEPGWHIYAAPVPEIYTPVSVTFEDPKVIRGSVTFPNAALLEVAALGETLPVLSGSFQAKGTLLLKFPLDAGEATLSGILRFQQCSDTVCEPPESIRFELAIALQPFMVASGGKSSERAEAAREKRET
jgi:hypothetical protein